MCQEFSLGGGCFPESRAFVKMHVGPLEMVVVVRVSGFRAYLCPQTHMGVSDNLGTLFGGSL